MSQRTFPLAQAFHATTRQARPVNVSLVRCPTVSNSGAVGQDAVPPLGLAYIASALRLAGHHVTAVDAVGEAVDQYSRIHGTKYALAHGLSSRQIIERIDPHVEVIGIACMFSVEWLLVRELIESIRAAFPHAHIVLGGEHATACPEYSLEDSLADVCVL